MLFELSGDCAACRVQGAVSETWDTEAWPYRFGLPVSTRCRLCTASAEATEDAAGPAAARAPSGCPRCGGDLDEAMRDAHRCGMCGASGGLRETSAPSPFASREALSAALARWASEEGHASADELVEASFVVESVDEVFALLSRGESVETTFDVAGFLFSAGGYAGGGTEVAAIREEEPPDTLREPARFSMPASLRKVGGPREELLALASVAAADGETAFGDVEALSRAAEKRGLPPLPQADLRVWRPGEIEPPGSLVDRERVLEEMFQLAWADGQMDESELRVIRDYARAWGVDPARVREWIDLYDFADTNRFARWFRRIGLFLFPR